MTKLSYTLIGALTVGVASLATAETPNVQPGQWEYQTLITIDAPFPIPEQSDTSTDCITEADLAEADTFMGDMDMEGCEMTREEMKRDSAHYEMVCETDGLTMDMTFDLKFMGDQSEGLIVSQAETPAGPMTTTIEMTGRLLGECE